MARILRNAGHEVFTPTLTGTGDRFHLGSASVTMSTHIQDIVATIEFEDLNDPRIPAFEEMLNQVSDFILTIWVLANDYIIAKHTGVNFTNYGPPHTSAIDKNILPKAIAIYAPDQSGFQNFPDIQYIAFRTKLFKITTWDDFLDKINR